MVVSSSVVANAGVPPELVDSERAYITWNINTHKSMATITHQMRISLTEEHIGVVELVVLGNPSADESPGGLDGGVSAEAGNLLGLAAELGLGPEVLGGQLCGEGGVSLLNKV